MDIQTVNVVKLLARFPVFAKLSHQEQAQLAQLAVRKSYQRGEYVAHSGDVWPYVIIIDFGEIHAMKNVARGTQLWNAEITSGRRILEPHVV